ncbi:MAG: T9SS type A sorting domain-containing protein [Ferruginibacter sp.]|nr:T9SS type A sorting domain-containing protein [Ferruginibacter sp.]
MQSKILIQIFLLLVLKVVMIEKVIGQIVSSNAYLKGNYVEVGIGPCGTYGSSVDAPAGYHPRGNGLFEKRLGFIADPNKDGWDVGSPNYCGDYFVPGTPEEGFGIQINGVNYNNNLLCSEVSITGSITDYKISGTNILGTWSGAIAGVQITTVTTVPLNDVFFISEVTLKNTTGATINNIYYMRNVDPDNEVTLPGGVYTTNNFVVAQNPNIGSKALVSATGLNYGCYLGLGTLDCRARVAFGGFSNRNPAAVWNGTGGLSQSGSTINDIAIAIAFKINSLAPGESTTFRFAHVLSAADLERALNLTVPTLQVNGIPVDNNGTVDVCAGVPVPLQIINGSAYNFTWSPSTGLNTTTGLSVIATVNASTKYTAAGVDACGSNVSLSVTLNPGSTSVLGTIGAISGPASICLPAANQTYSVVPVPNATLYEWTVPAGVSIVGGDGTNSVTLSFTLPVTGTVSVKARNGCSVTNTSTLTINASTTNPPVVTFNDVNTSAPLGGSGINVTYPAPINSGSIPVTYIYSPASGSFFPLGSTIVNVTASNSCGSVIKSFTVTVTETPDPNVYYSKASGDLHNLLTWGVNPDGSGANPSDFGSLKTFNLVNRGGVYTLTGNWTVEGIIVNSAGSQLQVNGYTLSIAAIMGAGTITGSTASNLVIKGSAGGNLTLNFTSGGGSLNDLTLNRTGASPSATVASALNIYGVLTVTNGTLNTGNFITLKSNAANTARVAPVTGSISGNATVERYIPARRAWRIMCAPVGGAQTINQAWQEGATTSSAVPDPNPGFGTHITEGLADGFDHNPVSAMSSIKKYISATDKWLALTNTNVNTVNSDAFFLFVRGDRGVSLGYNNVPPNNTVLRATGTLKTGNQSFPVNAVGFTAIPNPFASPIDFATLTRTNVQNNFYLWDPKLGGGTGAGAYVLFSFNGSSYDVSPAPVSPESQYIQSGQGFLVRSTGSAGSLLIKESDKSATAATNVFRSSATTKGLRATLQVVNKDKTTAVLDESFTSYGAFSNKVDNMDPVKLENINENIGISRDGQTLMMERRQEVTGNDTIHLQLWNTVQREYVLQLSPVNLSASTIISGYLEDAYLHTTTPISLSELTKVSFSVDENAASANPNRFRVVLVGKNALPAISSAVKGLIRLTPNPITGKTINIQFIVQPKGTYQIELVNTMGQVMYQAKVKHAGGSAIQTLQLTNNMSKGVYRMRVTNAAAGIKYAIPVLSN